MSGLVNKTERKSRESERDLIRANGCIFYPLVGCGQICMAATN